MKRIFLLAMLSAALIACRKQQTETISYSEIDWDNVNNCMCEQDQWFRIPSDVKPTALILNLQDAYNAEVVLHSAYSDMELFWRWECRTDTAMRELDLSIFHDNDTKNEASRLLTTFADAQADSTIDVSEVLYAFEAMLCQRYHASCFMDTGMITEEVYWQALDKSQWVNDYDALYALRDKSDSLHQASLLERFGRSKDINERCVLALEYAHSSEDGPYFTQAIPLLEQVLTAGEYSPLLMEAWRTWRALMTTRMGASKDSDIPNAEFNALRRVCCTTMLRHIAAHPDDWMAINNFLVCGYLDNILRYGDYPFGNQSMMERLEVFCTYYDRILGRTHEE